MNDSDLEIRWTRGSGAGGQHRNKTENCCVLTHRPTGIKVAIDGRSRRANLKEAKKVMRQCIEEFNEAIRARCKKENRDAKIKDSTRVRTYDYTSGCVTDHRTRKKASVKDVLEKGQLGKLR